MTVTMTVTVTFATTVTRDRVTYVMRMGLSCSSRHLQDIPAIHMQIDGEAIKVYRPLDIEIRRSVGMGGFVDGVGQGGGAGGCGDGGVCMYWSCLICAHVSQLQKTMVQRPQEWCLKVKKRRIVEHFIGTLIRWWMVETHFVLVIMVLWLCTVHCIQYYSNNFVKFILRTGIPVLIPLEWYLICKWYSARTRQHTDCVNRLWVGSTEKSGRPELTITVSLVTHHWWWLIDCLFQHLGWKIQIHWMFSTLLLTGTQNTNVWIIQFLLIEHNLP